MSIAQNAPVTRIATDVPTVYAFRISGEITGDDMEAMSHVMNTAFDNNETVSMLLLFDGYEGRETGAGLNWESIKAQFRSLANVEKYAVVGAPSGAAAMIDFMDKIIPVDARSFPASDESAAWAFVGARAVASG